MSQFLQKMKEKSKRVGIIMFWCVVSVMSYIIINKEFIESSDKIDTKVYTYQDISTAINEQHQLIITDRNTGLYKIYSDSVMIGIHGMWSTYIQKLFLDKSSR